MTRSVSKNLVAMLTVVLLLIIAVPATSFGKDRGRRGRGGPDTGSVANLLTAMTRGMAVGTVVARDEILPAGMAQQS